MTEPSPLDVAVQVDPVEKYRAAVRLGVKHFPDNPTAFADRLRGETLEDLVADAQELAETIADLRAAAESPRVMAIDPSQGQGPSGAPTPDQRFQKRLHDFLDNSLTYRPSDYRP